MRRATVIDQKVFDVPKLSPKPTQSAPYSEPPTNRLALTVNEVAETLGVSRQSVYNALERGDLPSKRLAGRLLIPVADLLAFLDVSPTPSARRYREEQTTLAS